MSKRFLKSAQYSVHKLFANVANLSFKARHDYEQILKLMMSQLHEAGVPISHVSHLKQRQVKHLVVRWQQEGLNPATIKNRVSALRYVARCINKPTIVPSNTDLKLAPRQYIPTQSKAIHEIDLTRLTDPYINYSVRLQQQFGLRREESIKFIPSKADQGTYIILQGSWTKGGIQRIVPVTTSEQRQLLDELASAIPKGTALIPKHKTYREQEKLYNAQVRASGYRNLHGLRHAYAQHRYQVLTARLFGGQGWCSPSQGGLAYKQLDAKQKIVDEQARLVISEEMGHSRISVTKIYCF